MGRVSKFGGRLCIMLRHVTALRAIGVAALCLASTACNPRQVDFRLTFADGATQTASEVLFVSITNGECNSGATPSFTTTFAVDDPEGAASPPVLTPGRYAFAAEARDSDCQILASACTARDLPLDEDLLVLELDTETPTAACPPEMCTNGVCQGDVLPDAGPPPDEDAGDEPDAGPGMMCSGDGECTNGTCRDNVCCFGCWDGVACQAGLSDAACGGNGVECMACGSTENCVGGSCVDGPAVSLSLSATMSFIRINGRLYSAGFNSMQQRGTLEDVSPNVFAQQTTGISFVDVAAGQITTCGIDNGGRLYCWGSNANGALGQADTNSGRSETVPQAVGSDRWIDVDAGNFHFCAINDAAELYCWGANMSGALGVGASGSRFEPTQIDGGGMWSAVSAGETHTCAIRADGALFCWGDAEYGKLGVMDTSNSPSPVRVGSETDWTSISAGTRHTCGIRNRELHCWGTREFGRLGNGTGGDQATPVLIDATNEWRSISCGQFHSCGTTLSNEVFCFGISPRGQMGTAEDGQNAPVFVVAGYDQVEAGYTHTCAAATDDATLTNARCWGEGTDGRLGTGTIDDEPAPAAPMFLPAP